MKMIYDMCTGQLVEPSLPGPVSGLESTAEAALLPLLRLQEITSQPHEALRFPPGLAAADLTLFLKQMD